ncbi:hypothetical protein [Pilimelia columellifera]|uniref:hypothetical protein n=1 Tax=Pilimelia columellifera TaxID=706574 RepID=UPI0031E1642B
MTYQRFLADAGAFWRSETRPTDPGACVLADARHHDLRVLLRTLTVANALRRLTPARLVVLANPAPCWPLAWGVPYDLDAVMELAAAFAADEVIDVDAFAERRLAELATARATPTVDELAPDVDAAYRRITGAPSVTEAARRNQDYRRLHARIRVLSRFYAELIAERAPVALVTSEVDYDEWGAAVLEARRAGVPVIQPLAGGALRAYALFPEQDHGAPTFGAALTPLIGEFFGAQVWPRREHWRRGVRRVLARDRAGRGRPTDARTGPNAAVEIENPTQRRQVRQHVARRLGFDPNRPVAVVFRHRAQDPVDARAAAFPDGDAWLDATVAVARSAREINWLFLDAPDPAPPAAPPTTARPEDRFAATARECAGHTHLAFRPAAAFSRNALLSLADLGVTLHDPVAVEFVAYGLPVVQAGWSPWSDCGLGPVVTDPDQHRRALVAAVAELAADRPPMTGEQIERARLWLWLDRAGADVAGPLVPTWAAWPAEHLLRPLGAYLRHVDPDGDPVFAAVERLWRTRAPLLTRADVAVEVDRSPRSDAAPTVVGVGMVPQTRSSRAAAAAHE